MRRVLALSFVLYAAAHVEANDDPAATPPYAESRDVPQQSDKPKDKSEKKDEPKPVRAPPDEPAAPDVATAPLPGQESGRTDPFDRESLPRKIGQGMLAIPKVALEGALAPVRLGVWVYDRYSLFAKFKRASFDKTETYGMYPTLHIDSSYGATIGGRVVHRSLFGAREHFALRGGFGGEFRQLVDAGLRSGERFGKHVSLELRGEFERRPRDPFYGIGNNHDPMYVKHRQEIWRATSVVDIHPAGRMLHFRASGAVSDLEFAPTGADTPQIDELYDQSMLTGWTGMRNVYGELEVRWDGRVHTSKYDHSAVFDQGTLLAAFVGRVHQLQAGGDYYRYGGEAMRFFPLGFSRVISARAHVEAVTGEYSDVAFTQLPQLGGKSLLRGYPAERFRDRTAALGSAEYFWGLNRFLVASLFVDVGRVFPSLQDLSTDDMRLGYGASIQVHEHNSFLASVSVASSIDGGVFVNLALDPVFKPPARVEQK